jgi:serine protease Do
MPVPGFGEIAEKLRRSTVHVAAGHRGRGSGIIVEPGGVIVTNAHVAAHGPLQVQLWDGTWEHARPRSPPRSTVRTARSSVD